MHPVSVHLVCTDDSPGKRNSRSRCWKHWRSLDPFSEDFRQPSQNHPGHYFLHPIYAAPVPPNFEEINIIFVVSFSDQIKDDSQS